MFLTRRIVRGNSRAGHSTDETQLARHRLERGAGEQATNLHLI